MGEIVFVGLGLYDEAGISLRGLEETRTADSVFIELYTSLMPNLSIKRLEATCDKSIIEVTRKELEDENGKVVLTAAKNGKAVILVPGDPLIATTHVALRIDAAKQGIKTRIVHGASIVSAVIGLSGLHNYKFGKTVTIPFPETHSTTPYNVIAKNKAAGLHTLCLLDIQASQKRYLSTNEALQMLLKTEKKEGKGVATPRTLVVGVARAGSRSPTVKAGFIGEMLSFNFGNPPHSLIFPGELHFMEAEALIVLAGAPEELRRGV
ncbi:diphthine synthase [Candidatus Bathyarchaeota archaeon]|nr:diphthine synthase [Candidatus Bathyarchaeota archaeon]